MAKRGDEEGPLDVTGRALSKGIEALRAQRRLDLMAMCPRCGSSAGVVRVHGHGQCRACGANIEPCCEE